MSSGSSKLYTQSNLNPGGAAAPAVGGGLWSSPKLAPAVGSGMSDGTSSPASEMLLNFSVQQPTPKPKPTVTTYSTTNGGNIPALDGASDITNGLLRLNTNEEREVSDSVAPLTKAHNKSSNTSSGGLWGAKAAPKNNVGLWGPPRLDDVYEHGRGPKRRWTMTERDESL
jgi:hypothetical protein